ncbi:MAG TPA: CRISPR-associated helicase Cas3' [Candidatus Rifleibacterium sp.]|nr:CRISPR-associated helicase Cas3' [Candidatus Rifleibacterium sp.]
MIEASLKTHYLLWGKTGPDENWHPLLLHMVDVAAVADAILEREPQATRQMLANSFGLPWSDARPFLLQIIACHDLGKACPAFQIKWDQAKPILEKCDLRFRSNIAKDIKHGYVSQLSLTSFLQKTDKTDLCELLADAVGCHHGQRASPTMLNNTQNTKNIGDDSWQKIRETLFAEITSLFEVKTQLKKDFITGPEFMLIAGLTSFSDWIGSNENWFSFGKPDDCKNLNDWFNMRKKIAHQALEAIGWNYRLPLSDKGLNFADLFPFKPRPLQAKMAKIVNKLEKPCLILVEAPMGEGKTEAAFFAHVEMQRRFGHRGLYVALPTKATGNAMYQRTLDFLKSFGGNRQLDLQLLHGATLLNETFQMLVTDSNASEGDKVLASEWFTHKKRALLSEYGVGTVDQGLLSVLPVRHNFVRLWGLANRVIVFDEIHAYDAYTGTLLLHLIHWLINLGSSIILLSATLPPSFKRHLAALNAASLPDNEEAYPRISVFRPKSVEQYSFAADESCSRNITVNGIPTGIEDIQKVIKQELPDTGSALIIVNTVQRAQEVYKSFPGGSKMLRNSICIGKRLADGTEVFLFHARFPANSRQEREDNALATFGKNARRNGRKILIGTQVTEQSLDLDFDLMVTDLAPIDLILQRAGRLWRHPGLKRPLEKPELFIAGLTPEIGSFEKPLWWNRIYREDLLIRTWNRLRNQNVIRLPADIDCLVNDVYECNDDGLPAELLNRLDRAECDGAGRQLAYRQQASLEFIGFPDDDSWNDTARYAKADEDEPGLHKSLVAQTRLGEQAVMVVPVFSNDDENLKSRLSMLEAKQFFLKAISITRAGVVKTLVAKGVPENWQKSPLLRNCYPLLLDEKNRWIDDQNVELNDELGLIYGTKEKQ